MKQLLVRELSPVRAPEVVCAALAGLPYRIFFDSADRSGKYARYSFVAADPVSVIRAKGSSIETCQSSRRDVALSGNALIHLRQLLADFSFQPVAGLPPFQGGAAGYIGYEFGSALEKIPSQKDDLGIPDCCLGIYDVVFSWDHVTGKAWLVSQSSEREMFFLDLLAMYIQPDVPHRSGGGVPRVESSLTRDEYRKALQRIRDYIVAGDIFQANFAQRFHTSLSVQPWDLYLMLREKNPAPFGCFFETEPVTVVSASPERFISVDRQKVAETRPIKGTRPRMENPDADVASREELSASAKDNAEHVMIVDVLRNDLSRVCETGSVEVIALAEPEAHPTVHHLVSTIRGRIRSDCDSIDLLLAALPGGSITGAPKIRAMEIISELEPVRRDIYCGCMLYMRPDGAMDSSIAIRTFLARGGKAYFSAGGGIVADSNADMEFEETLHKAAGLFSALESVT